MSVNENTTSFLTISFFDENGVPVIPTAATYRIDDSGGTGIVGTTALALASSVVVTVTSNQNRILNAAKPFETRIVTVVFDYESGTKHGTSDYTYEVNNLAFV